MKDLLRQAAISWLVILIGIASLVPIQAARAEERKLTRDEALQFTFQCESKNIQRTVDNVKDAISKGEFSNPFTLGTDFIAYEAFCNAVKFISFVLGQLGCFLWRTFIDPVFNVGPDGEQLSDSCSQLNPKITEERPNNTSTNGNGSGSTPTATDSSAPPPPNR